MAILGAGAEILRVHDGRPVRHHAAACRKRVRLESKGTADVHDHRPRPWAIRSGPDGEVAHAPCADGGDERYGVRPRRYIQLRRTAHARERNDGVLLCKPDVRKSIEFVYGNSPGRHGRPCNSYQRSECQLASDHGSVALIEALAQGAVRVSSKYHAVTENAAWCET